MTAYRSPLHSLLSCFFVLTFLSLSVDAVAQTHANPLGEPKYSGISEYNSEIEQAREMIINFMDEYGVPGLSIAIGKDGKMIWSEGFGYADIENGVRVTPLTRFRSGSISKTKTAAAMGVLIEDGRLDLEASVYDYLPDYPQKQYDFTVAQTAGHTAGIRHYKSGSNEFLSNVRYDDVTSPLDVFNGDPLLFEPGTSYSYSTYGWSVISAVVEAAAGENYLTFMQREVFEPLGMRYTVADYADSLISHRTSYYERTGGPSSYRTSQRNDEEGRPGELLNAPFVDNSNKWAGGGYLSTPEDLVRFGFGHLEGAGYLEDETLELLQTSLMLDNGEETGYGIGWRHNTIEDLNLAVVGHSGGSVGGTSRFLIVPEEGWVIAIQANLSNTPFGRMDRDILKLFIGDPTLRAQN